MNSSTLSQTFGLNPAKKQTFLLVVICGYIFLMTDRPWESISYLNGIRLQLIYAGFMILVAIFSGRLVIRKAPTNFWVLGLLCLHFILAPFAFSPSAAVDQGFEYAKAVLLYCLMIAAVDDEADLKSLLKAFALSMILYTLHSLWEFSNGRYVYRMDMIRMVGVGEVFSDPNAFGASLVFSVPVVYVLVRFEAIKWLRRLYYSYIYVLVPVCVVMTGSRSAFIALLCCGILGALNLKGGKRLLALVLAVLVVVGGWQLMPEDKQERMRTLWDENAGPKSAHESADGRMEGFLISWEMFKQRPITGVGAGGENYIGYRVAMGESPFQAHNLYGEVLSEFGIFGAFLFVGLIGTMLKSCVLVRKKHIEKMTTSNFAQTMAAAFMLSLILLLIIGLGGHVFYRPLWLYFAAWSSLIFKLAEPSPVITVICNEGIASSVSTIKNYSIK